MEITTREMGPVDQPVWTQLRAGLWPEETLEDHQRELEEFLKRGNFWGFIAELSDSRAVGFAEVALRDYANGCVSRPVAFLEGIWVRPQFRRQGIGARLLEKIEEFLVARGFTELGSDVLIDNAESRAAHAVWGFAETERVIYFRKDLKPAKR